MNFTTWLCVMIVVYVALQFPTANYFNSNAYDATNGLTKMKLQKLDHQ